MDVRVVWIIQLVHKPCVDHKEGWALKNWCFWTMVLEKILESPLECKEIKPVNPKGNQSWLFIGRTDAESEAPVLWPLDVKSQLTGKDLDAGEDKKQEERGGWQRTRWLDWITDSMDMSLSWCAVVHGVTKSWTQVSNWTTVTTTP